VKYARALYATLLFVALLAAVYVLHMRFVPVDVLLYSAIADGVIAAALAGVVVFAAPAFRVFSGLEKAQLLVIWLLAGYAFAISVPTVLDRSLSFYILEKLQQRGGGIRHDKFALVFTEEYVKEHRLVDIRLTEQVQSGTVRIEGGCVKLTERGERLASFSRFFRAHLLPRERLIAGKYSDDLVDPFRGSPERVDYRCR
jgi:hypothetical protein